MNCDRCGTRIVNRHFVSMSEEGKNPHSVCLECHEIWMQIYEERLKPIDETIIYKTVWEREYRAFIANESSRERVQFT